MLILTQPIRAALQRNAATPGDHAPVLKLFNPCGAATWLATELADDGDTLFGLADLGFGTPELGSFSLREIMALRLAHGLRVERDRSFEGIAPLSVYADAARRAGGIVESAALLRPAAPVEPTREAQLAHLRAASPLRGSKPAHDVDGLGLFDHARQPRMI